MAAAPPSPAPRAGNDRRLDPQYLSFVVCFWRINGRLPPPFPFIRSPCSPFPPPQIPTFRTRSFSFPTEGCRRGLLRFFICSPVRFVNPKQRFRTQYIIFEALFPIFFINTKNPFIRFKKWISMWIMWITYPHEGKNRPRKCGYLSLARFSPHGSIIVS